MNGRDEPSRHQRNNTWLPLDKEQEVPHIAGGKFRWQTEKRKFSPRNCPLTKPLPPPLMETGMCLAAVKAGETKVGDG